MSLLKGTLLEGCMFIPFMVGTLVFAVIAAIAEWYSDKHNNSDSFKSGVTIGLLVGLLAGVVTALV